MTEYFQTGMKKGRGRAQRSLDIIQAMYKIAEEGQPITGRGVGYKLFSLNLIPSMGRNDMQMVYRLLKEAREEGTIPWEWIVDETRELEQVATWDNPAEFVRCVARSYRRDFWQQQPERIEVWSEKGTVRGVLQPLLDEYAVGFRVMHGFGSATTINDVSQNDDSHPLTILYIGDYDPSGLWMSEHDIPERLSRYGGDHTLTSSRGNEMKKNIQEEIYTEEDVIVQRWVDLFERMHGRPATNEEEILQWMDSLVREHSKNLS